jgi:hypothetical protein
MDSDTLYYPPRASRFGRLRYRWKRLTAFRRRPKIHPAAVRDFVLSLLIPGFAFRAYRRAIGAWVMGAYLACALFFFIWLGYPVANWSFAALLSLHASSIAFLIRFLAPNLRLVYRILITVWLILFLHTSVYLPLKGQLDQFVLPLRIADKVIVARLTAPGDVKKGDWIVYEIEEGGIGHLVQLRGGYGFSPALATPGDIVEFEKGTYSVNGRSFPSQPYMPMKGGFTVPEKQWFVWPSVAISGRTAAGQSAITQMLKSQSLISEDRFVGKPFKRWFWRKQVEE